MPEALESQLRAANARVEKARQRLAAATVAYETKLADATEERAAILRTQLEDAESGLAIELDRVRFIEKSIKERDAARRQAADEARWAAARESLDDARRLAASVDAHVAAAGEAFRQIVALVEGVPVAAEYGAHYHAAAVQSALDVALAKAGLGANVRNSGDVRPTDLRVEETVRRIANAIPQLPREAA